MGFANSRRAILAALTFFFVNISAALCVAEAISCVQSDPGPSTPEDIDALGKETLNTVVISSRDDLPHLLERISSPSLVLLSPGDYASLELRGLRFNRPVILRSLDPLDPARMNGLKLRHVTNLHFEQVAFMGTSGMQRHTRPFQILNSAKVRFQEVHFLGSTDTEFAFGQALFVRNSKDIAVLKSTFRNWHRAAVFRSSRRLAVCGNEITAMTSDGLNFSAVTSAVVENNTISDFHRDLSSNDHADMIQFWTRGTDTPSRDILIRNNLLDAGSGWFTQSIFMRNEVLDHHPNATDMAYRDLRIEGNVIRNAHTHGITIGQVDGLLVRDNVLTRTANAARAGMSLGQSTPIIRVHPDSQNVSILENAVRRIAGHINQESWLLDRNTAPNPDQMVNH